MLLFFFNVQHTVKPQHIVIVDYLYIHVIIKGGIAPTRMIARSEVEVHRQINKE